MIGKDPLGGTKQDPKVFVTMVSENFMVILGRRERGVEEREGEKREGRRERGRRERGRRERGGEERGGEERGGEERGGEEREGKREGERRERSRRVIVSMVKCRSYLIILHEAKVFTTKKIQRWDFFDFPL